MISGFRMPSPPDLASHAVYRTATERLSLLVVAPCNVFRAVPHGPRFQTQNTHRWAPLPPGLAPGGWPTFHNPGEVMQFQRLPFIWLLWMAISLASPLEEARLICLGVSPTICLGRPQKGPLPQKTQFPGSPWNTNPSIALRWLFLDGWARSRVAAPSGWKEPVEAVGHLMSNCWEAPG